MSLLGLLVVGVLSVGCRAASPAPTSPASFGALGLPAALTKARLQGLLQKFVDQGYGRSFRHLGDERDFDHGHLLFAAGSRRPVAILYHTQESAYAPASAEFGYVDARARNWIQWIDNGVIENAERYRRRAYPRSASWDFFVRRELPGLTSRRTITDRMLDPALLGTELGESRQWEFTRVDCGSAPAGDSRVISVALPDRTPVCLALSAD